MYIFVNSICSGVYFNSTVSLMIFHLNDLLIAGSWVLKSPTITMGFPGGSVVKNLPSRQEIWIWSLEKRSPGGGNGNPAQYSCLGNRTDREPWEATVHGVAELDTT